MSDYKYVSTKPLEEFEVVKKARQKSGDLIRRQDAIEALKALQRCECRERDPGCWEDARDTIKALPSAEQKGKWISYIDFDGYVECPFCGSATNCESTEEAETLHYCFNCGARMKGEEE